MGSSVYKVDFQQVREMRLSVIIPIYNVEGYLSRCLDSVIVALGQLDVGWESEVICIDDGSTDGSSAILRDYANRDSRIKLIEQENRGLAAARNAGLDIAVGDWISFVDSDDWVEARYFKAMLNAAECEGAQMASVCTRTCPPEEYWCSHRGIPATAWGKAYRASLWGGVRFPNGRLHEDEFTVHRVVFKVDRVAGVEAQLYRYTHRSGSIMQNLDERNLRDWVEGCAAQAKYLKPISSRAYAVALAKKIQAAHWLGCVDKNDVEEYGKVMGRRIGNYYWVERYRHPILINRVTWQIVKFAKRMFRI